MGAPECVHLRPGAAVLQVEPVGRISGLVAVGSGAPASGSGHGVRVRLDAPSRFVMRDTAHRYTGGRGPRLIRRDCARESHRPVRGGGRRHCDGQGRGAAEESPSPECRGGAASGSTIGGPPRGPPVAAGCPTACRMADAAGEPAPPGRDGDRRGAVVGGSRNNHAPAGWASVTHAEPRGPSARWPARAMLPP